MNAKKKILDRVSKLEEQIEQPEKKEIDMHRQRIITKWRKKLTIQ